MEHRYSLRVAMNINLLIYKSGIPVAFGRVVNGSKLGFFIETDFRDINIDQSLEVEFIPEPNEDILCRCICSLRVIRKTAGGLGVEVEQTRTESVNAYGRARQNADYSRQYLGKCAL